ncbi:oxysterol-binding protein [Pseudoscourfieldia marina]
MLRSLSDLVANIVAPTTQEEDEQGKDEDFTMMMKKKNSSSINGGNNATSSPPSISQKEEQQLRRRVDPDSSSSDDGVGRGDGHHENVTAPDDNDNSEEDIVSAPTSEADRMTLFNNLNLTKYINKDVMSVASLPIFLFEPTTTLQRIAEIFEHGHALLILANSQQDPVMRMAYVAAFAVANYAGSERTGKPFNPILGETFEMVGGGGAGFTTATAATDDKRDDDAANDSTTKNFYLLAEQVSHHPPIGAAHAECTNHYEYSITSAPKTKFHGNSVTIYPINYTTVQLKSQRQETYRLRRTPVTAVNNLIVGGSMWTDTHGTLEICSDDGVTTCTLQFEQCGSFGEGHYEVMGTVRRNGVPQVAICGLWNEGLDAVACDVDGNPIDDADPISLWRVDPAYVEASKKNKYSMTPFVDRMNACDASSLGALVRRRNSGRACDLSAAVVDDGDRLLLPSDSRLRPDREALQRGDLSTAARWKGRLEEQQREERRRRDAEGTEYKPRYFTLRRRRGAEEEESNDDDAPMAIPYDVDLERFRRRADAAIMAATTMAPAAGDDDDDDGADDDCVKFAPWQYSD